MDDRNRTAVFYALANSWTAALQVPGNDLRFLNSFRPKKYTPYEWQVNFQ